MGRYGKIFLMMVAISSLMLLSSINVFAQPLKILSSKTQPQAKCRLLSCANGRFVFGQISDSGKDKFMLDTFSGRLWRVSKSGKIGMFLEPVPYRADKGKFSPVPGPTPDSLPEKAKKNKRPRR